jgi:hypothetical protein
MAYSVQGFAVRVKCIFNPAIFQDRTCNSKVVDFERRAKLRGLKKKALDGVSLIRQGVYFFSSL